MMRAALALGVLSLATAGTAQAGSTSNVFGPVVKEDAREIEYRLGFRPDEDGADDRVSQRIHYQAPFNGDLRWRILAQATTNSDGNIEYDYLQGELLWELSNDEDKWKRALRFDARLRDGDRPNQFGINFTNQVNLTDRVRARFIVLTLKQFGSNGDDGVSLETRTRVTYKTDLGPRIGWETYNTFGEIGDFTPVGEGRHQMGPYAVTPVGDGWNIITGVLFGVTDVSPDTDYRFWVSRSF